MGDIAIMGLSNIENSSYWLNSNSSTTLIDHNKSFAPYPYMYDLNRLDIRAYNLLNGSDIFKISENLTIRSAIQSATRIAQEFSSPNLIAINTLSLFLNFSMMSTIDNLHLRASIFDEDLEEEIEFSEKVFSELEDGWINFSFYSNILEANHTYNIVLRKWIETGRGNEVNKEINFWEAVNYSKKTDNNGLSRIYNEQLGWIPIVNP